MSIIIQFSGLPEPTRSVVAVEAGPGKIQMVNKTKEGRVEEWTMKFCPKGVEMVGTDRASGQSCKIMCERFTNIFGDFRVVTTAGCEEFLKTLGKFME